MIKSLADTILVCGQQCFALRGHRDDNTADDEGNRGNFLAVLRYGVRSGNVVLGEHFTTAPRNATYTSKTIQNDFTVLVSILGIELLDK